jgi:hypothetical protein
MTIRVGNFCWTLREHMGGAQLAKWIRHKRSQRCFRRSRALRLVGFLSASSDLNTRVASDPSSTAAT